MKPFINILAMVALFLTIVPSFLVFYDVFDLDICKKIMGFAAVMWLLTGPVLTSKSAKETDPTMNG